MIVVTGLMRSGTSPVARMLHQMGIGMGTFMRFPASWPGSHLEWEDAALSEYLLLHLSGKAELDIPKLLRSYMLTRSGEWGVKTPFLLPFLDTWRSLCKSLKKPVTVIMTERDHGETMKSLEKQSAHLPVSERRIAMDLCDRVQAKLYGALLDSPEPDLVVHHSNMQRDPMDVARQIAQVIDINPDLKRAVCGIGERN